MKFVLFLILGTYALSMDWVDFWLGEWHEICVIYYKVLGYANWGGVFDDFLQIQEKFCQSHPGIVFGCNVY